MISEGSCDTEYWSNDAEDSALHYRNKIYFKYMQLEKKFLIVHDTTGFTLFLKK